MLRRGTQFEITNELQQLKANDDIVSWLSVLGRELNINNINSLLIKIFLNIKHQLTDESLNNILKWLKGNCTSNNGDNHEPVATAANVSCKSQCQFNKIPNDVFYHIGSYLSYFDTIKLSRTNHLFHKKIHNKSFMNASNDCDENTLKLSEKRMACICKMETNYANLSYNRWNKLVIGDHDEYEGEDNTVVTHCSKYNQCSFCQIICQIDEYNNYDLQWFANILSHVKIINLSNNWPCLWNKIPLKWLLKKDDQVGASNSNMLATVASTNGHINDENGRAFADVYESYFMNECESNFNKIREIGSIDFGSSIDYCIRKMSQNYTNLACRDDSPLKCQTLSQFLTIIHPCVDSIRVNIHVETDFCQLFFDSSSDIYKDLMKDESIVSLESFKSKYSVDKNINILPRITSACINIYSYETTTNPHRKFVQILSDSNQDSKLMSVLNWGDSLKCLELRIAEPAMEKFDKEYHSVMDVFSPAIENFNQMECIQLEYIDIPNGEEKFDTFKSSIDIFLDRMESFFQDLHFEPILYKILYGWKSNGNGSNCANSINKFYEIMIGLNHRYFGYSQESTHAIQHTIIIDDIEPPYVHSCGQRAKIVSKQILQKIQNEKTRRIKCTEYNIKSIDLIIQFKTEHNL